MQKDGLDTADIVLKSNEIRYNVLSNSEADAVC
jgi:hypothetical protein